MQPGDVVTQALTLDQAHGEEVQAATLADLVEVHDVRVVKARRCLGLGVEPPDFEFAGELAGTDQLQRHWPMQLVVNGAVDDAHAAVRERFELAVVPELRPQMQVRLGCNAVGLGVRGGDGTGQGDGAILDNGERLGLSPATVGTGRHGRFHAGA
jgi:hypothetical protein